VEVSYGPQRLTNTKYKGPKSFQAPAEYARLTGRYQSDSAWGGDVRVYTINGRLVVDGTPLTPVGGSLFRVGEEGWSPLTAEFLHAFQGKTRLLRLAGMDYWRVEVD
jgi:hypothetical protein